MRVLICTHAIVLFGIHSYLYVYPKGKNGHLAANSSSVVGVLCRLAYPIAFDLDSDLHGFEHHIS